MKRLDIEPRVHGNGLIQIDLDRRVRVNVWSPLVPRQTISTPIHDHTFDFESTVICGTLIHKEYSVGKGDGEYQMYVSRPRVGEDTLLIRETDSKYVAMLARQIVLAEGDQYSFRAGTFHESVPSGLTATVMKKTAVSVRHASRVLCLSSVEPDNAFNRHAFTSADLWEVVREALLEANKDVLDSVCSRLPIVKSLIEFF